MDDMALQMQRRTSDIADAATDRAAEHSEPGEQTRGTRQEMIGLGICFRLRQS